MRRYLCPAHLGLAIWVPFIAKWTCAYFSTGSAVPIAVLSPTFSFKTKLVGRMWHAPAGYFRFRNSACCVRVRAGVAAVAGQAHKENKNERGAENGVLRSRPKRPVGIWREGQQHPHNNVISHRWLAHKTRSSCGHPAMY